MTDQIVTTLPANGTPMTAEEFFALPETNQHVELLNGRIVILSPAPVPDHQRTVFTSGKYVDTLKPNGEVFIAPIDVYLDDEHIPQPDVMWVAADSRCKITKKRLEGAPDLVIEVFSPSTERVDRSDKFRLYERYGVREYWMISPDAQYIEVYPLTDGKFVKQGIYGPDESFESAVLGGKTVNAAAIFGM